MICVVSGLSTLRLELPARFLDDLGKRAAGSSCEVISGRCSPVPIALIEGLLASGAVDAAPGILGSRVVSDALGASLANVLLSPFYALAAVLIALELSASCATAAVERPPAQPAAGVADATAPSSLPNGIVQG